MADLKLDYYGIPKSSIILQAEVGSRAWGLNLTEPCNCDTLVFNGVVGHFDGCASRKASDSDQMGICIEGLDKALGLSEWEQLVYRSASARTGKHDEPSGPGDLDLTIYGLRKFLRLALKGNPTILTLLYAPMTSWIQGDARGSHLQELAPYIVSRQAGKAFLGYLQAQRQRMTGERGGAHGAARSEDNEKYGYDRKYAMHMLRLGYQGVELLSTGTMSMPMGPSEREALLEVRRGNSTRDAVLTRAGELERELKDLLDSSPLRETPDSKFVENWMLDSYYETWRARYGNPGNDLRAQLGMKPLPRLESVYEYIRQAEAE